MYPVYIFNTVSQKILIQDDMNRESHLLVIIIKKEMLGTEQGGWANNREVIS